MYMYIYIYRLFEIDILCIFCLAFSCHFALFYVSVESKPHLQFSSEVDGPGSMLVLVLVLDAVPCAVCAYAWPGDSTRDTTSIYLTTYKTYRGGGEHGNFDV